MDPLLIVKQLKIAFQTSLEKAHVVDHMSFTIHRKEIVAFVGESGCGKSVTALSLTRLLPSPPAKILQGEVFFEGEDLLTLSTKKLRDIRGKGIAYVFQEPSLSLNPVFSIANQMREALPDYQGHTSHEVEERIIQALTDVKISHARDRLNSFPHQWSGGMKQRAMIAMALLFSPKLLVADEPTTALDVTIQRDIIHLLRDLHEQRHMSILLTTHNFGIVRDMAHRVYVMYAGEVVETAPTDELFRYPKHPYTKALMRAIPRKADHRNRLKTIPGDVPRNLNTLQGCRFANRCDQAQPSCFKEHPPLETINERTSVRCPFWT